VTLTVSAGTIDSIIGGDGGLTKSGAGTVILTSANTYGGATTVAAGTLRVNGTQTASAITVQSSATLQGNGTVGVVSVQAGATLAPGASPGILDTGNVTFAAGSTLAIELNGTTVDTQYDQLNVTGTVNLGGATLNVTLGFAPAIGTTFTIVNNDGSDAVNGTFAGLLEASMFAAGGQQFRINYAAGDGNDVVLTTLTAPSTPAPTPGPPTAFPPSVSPIAPQALAVNGSSTVSFSVSGAVTPSAITVRATSSNTALFPTGTLTLRRVADGNWQLTLQPANGRSGVATITVIANDGTQTGGMSFAVTVGQTTATPPGPPNAPTASASGSGVVMTWSPPSAPPETAPFVIERYAIAGATAPGGNDLPVVVTPDGLTSYVFSALPNGTYFFRVYAISAGGISAASSETSVTVAHGVAVPGPITAFRGSFAGTTATLNWTPSTATALTLFEFGSVPGASNLGTLPTTSTSLTADTAGIAAGTYWARARSSAGGATGAASNDIAITIGSGACSAAPGAPILLPVTIRAGEVTISWLPASGPTAARYRVIVNGTATGTLATAGAVSSLVIPARSGTFTTEVIAENSCGESARSNTVIVAIP
jgi:autotransporter-associated beta strand protein